MIRFEILITKYGIDMKGIIINFDRYKRLGCAFVNNKIIHFNIADNADISNINPLFEAEFSFIDNQYFISDKPSLRFENIKIDYTNTLESINDNYILNSESTDLTKAVENIAKFMQCYDIDAIGKLKVSYKKLKFSSKIIFSIACTLICYDKSKIKTINNRLLPRSRHISINKSIEKNVKILYSSLSIILIPCIFSLFKRNLLNNISSIALIGIIVLIWIYVLFLYEAKNNCIYILNKEQRFFK